MPRGSGQKKKKKEVLLLTEHHCMLRAMCKLLTCHLGSPQLQCGCGVPISEMGAPGGARAGPGRAGGPGTSPWPGLGRLQAGGSTQCLRKAVLREPRGGTVPGLALLSPHSTSVLMMGQPRGAQRPLRQPLLSVRSHPPPRLPADPSSAAERARLEAEGRTSESPSPSSSFSPHVCTVAPALDS